MWIMLFLLWVIPITIAILAWARVMDGMPALKDNERELFFDETKETEFGPWLALTFSALAVVFFILGLVQGIILPSLGSVWFVIGPLLTGSRGILVRALWLRSGQRQSPGGQNRISRMHTRAARVADILVG